MNCNGYFVAALNPKSSRPFEVDRREAGRFDNEELYLYDRNNTVDIFYKKLFQKLQSFNEEIMDHIRHLCRKLMSDKVI